MQRVARRTHRRASALLGRTESDGRAPRGQRSLRPRDAPPALAEVPTPDARHVLSRFTYGISEQLVAEFLEFGNSPAGTAAWFEQQLTPESIPDDYAASIRDWWPHVWW